MGLDKDLRFKVWAPLKHHDTICTAIQLALSDKWGELATEYLEALEVTILEEGFTLNRHAGMALLPGLRLHLANGDGVKLTAFFTSGKDIYAVSTSHLENLTGHLVWYDTGADRVVLGRIAACVFEGEPFREACLIKVNADRLSDISEYITNMTREESPRYIGDIYRGDAEDIPWVRDQGLMTSEPGHFQPLCCRAVMDVKHKGNTLQDAVVWTAVNNCGVPGDSGSGIFWKTPDGNYELVAMYIGRGEPQEKGLLISHTMTAALDYFNPDLQVFNPLNSLTTGGLYKGQDPCGTTTTSTGESQTRLPSVAATLDNAEPTPAPTAVPLESIPQLSFINSVVRNAQTTTVKRKHDIEEKRCKKVRHSS